MPTTEWVDLNPPERERRYIYPNNEAMTFANVNRIRVSESGNHYIETTGGQKAIVAPGWRAVELVVDNWTF